MNKQITRLFDSSEWFGKYRHFGKACNLDLRGKHKGEIRGLLVEYMYSIISEKFRLPKVICNNGPFLPYFDWATYCTLLQNHL